MTHKKTKVFSAPTTKSYKRLETLLNYKKNKWISRNFALSLKKRLFSGPNWNGGPSEAPLGAPPRYIVANGTDAGSPVFQGYVGGAGDVGRSSKEGQMLPRGEQPRRDQEDWEEARRSSRVVTMPNYERILRKEKLELYQVALERGRTSPSGYMPSRSSQLPPLVGDQWGGSRGGGPGGASVAQTHKPPTQVVATAKKIKYSINSYLLNVVSKFPRKYAYHFLGKEKLRKYYTMPFRLSMSRFLANRLARSYYMCISAKALEKMAKHAPSGGPLGAFEPRKGRMGGHNMNEKAKTFLSRLEQRLDVSILRLLNLKPTYIRKRMTPWHKQRWRAPALGTSPHPKQKYRLNSPISKYTSLQIKQLISRGSVRVNDKKVTTASRMIKVGDRVKVTGFMGSAGDIDQEAAPLALNVPRSIPHVGHKAPFRGDVSTRGCPPPLWGAATWGVAPLADARGAMCNTRPLSPPSAGYVPPPSGGDVPTVGGGARAITEWTKNHRDTILLRRFKDKNWLLDLQQTGGINSTLALPRSGKAPRGAPVEMDLAASRGGANLLDHIKNLRTKRFLEIYYVAYRNLHFFERPDEGGFDRPSTSTAGTLSGALHGEDVAALHVPPSGGPGGETSSASEGAGDQATSMASRNVVTTSNKVENHIKPLFDRIGYNQSIFLLWPITSMLQISSWGPGVKERFGALLKTRSPHQNKRALPGATAKDDKRELQKFLRWKRIQNGGGIRNAAPVGGGEKRSIPDEVIRILDSNPSFIYAESSRCYASIVYGTRKCKWVRLQQGAAKNYYSGVHKRTNFLEVELDFFQLTMEYYVS